MMQRNFDLQSFLPYLLNQAAEVSSLSFQQVYKDRYGMLRTEWRVLFHLGLYGQMSASEIGSRAKTHKTKVSRAVQRLTERRFVERALDSVDRRVTHLTLTKRGQAAYDDLRSVAESYEETLLKQLEPDEAVILRRALLKLGGVAPCDFT
ncbi:MarR family transcriptional regulator [Sulfitobacter sp. M57]|uniref:MarR family winged helix-turn-helix transcriptional regulator n=1 Tax=unclassified Sulfitobacter TaxID=196795 RepID=UPI0023E2681D|nr:MULTISPECIES: MarR family transcriptional regulator [unclassified Sulfitobacter]MDF3416248.1 MarR family transcriptional regulator [Sulfitobacter sp. KE5]MDF3423727.1 MarR family transcriptional regulator [Sulfitobacter sp. KE43]MDF3434794.1 MarR family transcriptional regulator [Sulfitobacter sp. KE42]MDF3460433.1 MarR family transcriptional regulator [Sulfitobacter sp. S74]MDF3464331.1 MarR family transcriptional regulator [Sulfitobacter sp. Ks18]